MHTDHTSNIATAIVLCLALAVGFSGCLLYCLKNRKLLDGSGFFGRRWIYRDDDSSCYWFYIAIYLFFDGVAIFGLITLLVKGSF